MASPALRRWRSASCVAALAGTLNGVLVTRVKLPPFIVTLGTLSIFTALALLYTKGRSVQASAMPALLSWTGKSLSIGSFRITTGVLITLGLYLVMGFALSQTAWGRHVYAVGDDADASRLAGIRVSRVLLSVYVTAGRDLRHRGLGADRARRRGEPELDHRCQPRLDHGGRDRRHQPVRWPRRRHRHAARRADRAVVHRGLSLAGVDDQYRLLAVGVLVIVAVALDQWIRQSNA